MKLKNLEREAKIIAEKRALAQKQERDKPKQAVNLETLFSQMQAGKSKRLNIIVKCDVNGSLEPIVSSLKKLETGELKVNVLLADTAVLARTIFYWQRLQTQWWLVLT